jgi:hypothetical protein
MLENRPNPKQDSIHEELDTIRQSKFRFGCLGVNCLGWIFIVILMLMLYFLKRYNILLIMA